MIEGAGKFEQGREIVERADAEQNAQELIDLVRERNKAHLGPGLEGSEELGVDDLAEKEGAAKVVMGRVADELERAEKFYHSLSGYVERGRDFGLNGKKLIDTLSKKDYPEKLIAFLGKTEGFIKETEWGDLLIKIGGYLRFKFPELEAEGKVRTFQEGEIEIEIPDLE